MPSRSVSSDPTGSAVNCRFQAKSLFERNWGQLFGFRADVPGSFERLHDKISHPYD